MKRFDIAIIGCGGIAPMHLDGYRRHPARVNVVAACDIIPERAEYTRQKYGADHTFASVTEAIEGAAWDVAVVCTPTPVREEVVKPLAAAGKHIFIEKPMADSIDEARRMVEICTKAGVKLAVDQTYRYHYGFDIARDVIDEGRLGKVLSVSQRDMHLRQDEEWRIHCKRHVLAVMGVHWLDGFRWMLQSEARIVNAFTHSSPAIDCVGETEASVQIAFENGAAVSYVQSFSCPDGKTDTVVVAEKGALVLGHGAQLFDKDHAGEPVESWENPYAGEGKPEATFKLLNELLTAIENENEPPNGCRDNLKTISLLEAAYRSAGHQQPITLDGGMMT